MIEITNVRKSFGTNEVLKGLDASVSKGEVVCIIGPSGSGKSTILRCINGLESYNSGQISIDGSTGGSPRSWPSATPSRRAPGPRSDPCTGWD